jgi:hypothetical protein
MKNEEVDCEWTAHLDTETGCAFYHNNTTGLTQWENPAGISHQQVETKENQVEMSNQRKVTPINIVGGVNIDYLHHAALYKINRPYSDPNAQSRCVLCRKSECNQVFFPCEHRVCCSSCISKENIYEFGSEMNMNANGHCNCPLCGGIIKKILPFEHGNYTI